MEGRAGRVLLSTEGKGRGAEGRGRDSYLIQGFKKRPQLLLPHHGLPAAAGGGGGGQDWELQWSSATFAALVATPTPHFTKSWLYLCQFLHNILM